MEAEFKLFEANHICEVKKKTHKEHPSDKKNVTLSVRSKKYFRKSSSKCDI